ncbi:hypothetical protein C2845_PM13G03710 [Panicum miliaceum]|uniref:At1g61320/AtMIF1 LRR domain-containing protein n=1 Tax=Panicum miliaceum TaxID=4540 RepID=A0A3L6RI79_PANMI|nr:hypothetical protein C2845_PM13G03710 [Panicum miliaceum]
MGLLALQRLVSLQRDRQRRNRPLNGGSIASVDKGRGSPCQHDACGDSQAAKRMMCSIPALPEDILHHIHSLLPFRDPARAACSSRAFLHSWRCRPILTLNRHILGSNANAPQESFSCRIDNILRNHSGIGIKIFVLELYGIFDACHYLDRWLQIAVTPGIEKLTLQLCHRDNMKYNVPCTLLSDGVRNSIQCLQLSLCAFHPTAELGPLRKLTSLCLRSVRISGDELEYFLSNSPALKQLDLSDCQEIMCLKIPCVLLQLHCLKVSYCWKLRVIESKARNLFSFILIGERVKVSLGETMQMKNLCMKLAGVVCYARTELPSNMPNLETVSIGSHRERVNTPMLPTKFLFLKRLAITLKCCPSYDYFSLVSFLDGSPSLETWLLDVGQESMDQASIFGGSSQLRQIPEQHHDHLKSVKIKGFSSAKSLVELLNMLYSQEREVT